MERRIQLPIGCILCDQAPYSHCSQQNRNIRKYKSLSKSISLCRNRSFSFNGYDQEMLPKELILVNDILDFDQMYAPVHDRISFPEFRQTCEKLWNKYKQLSKNRKKSLDAVISTPERDNKMAKKKVMGDYESGH